jgi:hypothetical protein
MEKEKLEELITQLEKEMPSLIDIDSDLMDNAERINLYLALKKYLERYYW